MADLSHQERLNRDLRRLLNAVLFVLGICVLMGLFGLGRDDTDPPGGRSGFGLYTDHGTGCQYITRLWSAPTPRVAADGQHMGCRALPHPRASGAVPDGGR